MSGRLLRALMMLATFTVVWLVVKPAQAAAPVCDRRAAITFAPPPQIQDPEQSLDIVTDCAPDSPLDISNVVPGRGVSTLDFSSSQVPMSLADVALPPPLAGERTHAPAAELAPPLPGFRDSLERPPQA